MKRTNNIVGRLTSNSSELRMTLHSLKPFGSVRSGPAAIAVCTEGSLASNKLTFITSACAVSVIQKWSGAHMCMRQLRRLCHQHKGSHASDLIIASDASEVRVKMPLSQVTHLSVQS